MKLSQLPRHSLGFFPTPLSELKNLSWLLKGPRIWIKRDDLTGLAFGGNKTRKLEFLIGDALAQGADTLVTGGAAQSNHCRQTAAAAAMCGLECHLVLGGAPPSVANGNLLLDGILGAHIHWSGELRKGENIPQIVAQLKAAGKSPYVVPYGGSSKVGALGYIEAMRELEQQLAGTGERISHMVFASSSGGTHAGLMVGKHIFNLASNVIGIQTEKESAGELSLEQTILTLANDAAAHLGVEARFSEKDLHLQADYVGGGYGVVGELEREAITLLATREGILLDPVYTARAMGGLIDLIRRDEFAQDDNVLFWHTGGGPALFAYADKLNS
jgi:D-cysteine desulfhydrase family pyridoxal phosphate-dependent enzyme